jgi:hypothetical protein
MERTDGGLWVWNDSISIDPAVAAAPGRHLYGQVDEEPVVLLLAKDHQVDERGAHMTLLSAPSTLVLGLRRASFAPSRAAGRTSRHHSGRPSPRQRRFERRLLDAEARSLPAYTLSNAIARLSAIASPAVGLLHSLVTRRACTRSAARLVAPRLAGRPATRLAGDKCVAPLRSGRHPDRRPGQPALLSVRVLERSPAACVRKREACDQSQADVLAARDVRAGVG